MAYPSPATAIEKFCIDNDIMLIEDSAEAHGQTEEGQKCGSFGKMSTLSFMQTNILQRGEGGAILTDSIDDFKR